MRASFVLAMAALAALSTGIAHEVGTPLGVIVGRVEQVLDRVTDERAAQRVEFPKDGCITCSGAAAALQLPASGVHALRQRHDLMQGIVQASERVREWCRAAAGAGQALLQNVKKRIPTGNVFYSTALLKNGIHVNI